MRLDLSEDQSRAADIIRDWRSNGICGSGEYMTLGGYAGTGKTSLVSCLTSEWGGVSVVAYTGKAASVLRAKGVDAQTIHSLIYVPQPGIGGRVHFRKRDYLEGTRCIVVDEASMVDHVIMQDLLSFGVPVLFVGDHGQLEPIGTNPGLMKNPKVRLEKIHRQAEGNPIIRLATAFRESRPTPYWSDPDGRLRVARKGEFRDMIAPDWQMICGYNATRHEVNRAVRASLGFAGHTLCPGDRVICLRNNKRWFVFNGQLLDVVSVDARNRSTLHVGLRDELGGTVHAPCLVDQFGVNAIEDFRSPDILMLDYGYCLTAHKSQGSTIRSVLALEEISRSWDAKRWRYTVATRASERLVYCA